MKNLANSYSKHTDTKPKTQVNGSPSVDLFNLPIEDDSPMLVTQTTPKISNTSI